MNYEPDIIIPVCLDLDWPSKDDIVSAILEQNEKYGFKSFALSGPGAGWRSATYPDIDVFENLGRLYREVKNELSHKGFTLGWWDTLTIKSGRSKDFQPIIKADGTEHPFANCPLGENFRKRFAKNISAFSKIAKPEYIIFEDDYSVNAAAGGYGCFCPLHLSEFNKREGKKYNREELLSIFKKRDSESLGIYRRYRELTKDSLVGLSEELRRELDKESPEIPMGLMQPGSTDSDGFSTLAVCKALAGERHTPFSRIYGAYYCGGELKGIPKRLFHAIYSREQIDGEFKFYHESDTFPHTRFFSSAKQMKAFMAIAYSSGFIGSTFQTQQLLDDPSEESAYGEMFKGERERFTEVIRLSSTSKRSGASLPYDPFYSSLNPTDANDPYWCKTLDYFGIPFTTRRAEVTFLDRRLAEFAPDEEIKSLLSSVLFIDSDAAYELCKRGYGKYIGVKVGEDVATDKIIYDLGAREVILPPYDTLSKGKNMPIAHMFASGGNGILRELTPTDDRTEIISEALTFDKKFLTAAMTYFENDLGGRVTVMGTTLYENKSQCLFNYRRKRIFEHLLARANASFPFVKEEPCVHLIFNVAENTDELSYMITLINLGDDTVENLPLYLPERMREKEIFFIDSCGKWQKATYEKSTDGIILGHPLELCEPVYLVFKSKPRVERVVCTSPSRA